MKQAKLEEQLKEEFYKKFGKDTTIVNNNCELVEPIVAVWNFFEPFLYRVGKFVNEEYLDGYQTKEKEILKTHIPISEVEEWLKVDHPKGIVDAKPFYECLDYIAERLEQYKRNKEEVAE